MLYTHNSCQNPRQGEYYTYLSQHIENVQRSYQQFLRSVVQEHYPEELEACDVAVAFHDASKYEDIEFGPYCDYFYPCKGFEKDDESFDLAWLRHQHVNPHHWQHWVLLKDAGETTLLDMPLSEIVNMCCDWHSFSANDPDSTAYNWYTANKDIMLLSEVTREYVTFFLQYLHEPLVVR